MTITDFFEYLTGQVDHQPWRERAACKGLGPDLFYVERGDSTREAKAVCRECEVQAECLEFAQTNMERHGGVWGGLSDRQRRAMRREEGPARGDELRRERVSLRLSGTHPRRNGAA